MRPIIFQFVFVVLGVLATRVIFSSFYKPDKPVSKVLSYLVGGAIACYFYWSWATTGMDPIQLSICNAFETSPGCVGRAQGSIRPEPQALKSIPLPENSSLFGGTKGVSSQYNSGNPSLYPRCAGSSVPEKCAREEQELRNESPRQAQERRARLEHQREASMNTVNSSSDNTSLVGRTTEVSSQYNPGNPSLYPRCAGSSVPEKCAREEQDLANESPRQVQERRARLERQREASMNIVNSSSDNTN
jgi:hypothetical protein